MAIAGTLWKLVWGGRLFSNETWSASIHLIPPVGLTTTEQPITDALVAYHTSSGAKVMGVAHLDFYKLNAIDPATGKYANQAEAATVAVGAQPVGSGGAAPGQLANVVSLTTGLQRGRGHIGRFYLPCGSSMSLDVDGRITATDAMAISNATKTFLNTIHTVTTGQPVVFSRIGQTATPILGVKVGRVIDTQRRRRASMVEDYQSVLL